MTTSAAPRRLQITLLQERSSGTFAKVYLAEALGAGGISRLVAVKVLREKWAHSEEFLSRTRDEAHMLAALRHPSIVRVEDLVELDGQLAIVMEFVNGLDLQQVVDGLRKRNEPVPRRTAYTIVQRVASALDTAYRKVPFGHSQPIQVVHRDIKPSNMMLTPEGELKVLDFGTARGSFEDRSAKTTMFRFGSLKYMSPERRLGDRGDHAGDIYALGLLLIELLHGKWLGLLPEPPDHDTAVDEAIDEVTDTGMQSEDWDGAVRKVLAQMCATEPQDRPAAEQVVKLMRAFGDQASGASLEAFCGDVVESLGRELFPPVPPRSEANKRFVIGGEGNTATAQGSPEPVSATPSPEPVSSSGPQPVQSPPVQAPPVQAPQVQPPVQAPPVQAPPAQAPPVQAPPVSVLSPQAAALNNPAERRAEPTMVPEYMPVSEPSARVRPVAPPVEELEGPHAADTEPSYAEPSPPLPSTGRNPRRMVLFALGGAVLVGFAMVVAAGLTVFFLMDPNTPTPGPTPEGPAPLEKLADEGGTSLKVLADDDSVQSIKVLDKKGEQLLKGGREGLTGSLEPGDYRLAIKLVGRGSYSADLEVGDEPLSFSCTSSKGGPVICEGDSGAATLTLKPE